MSVLGTSTHNPSSFPIPGGIGKSGPGKEEDFVFNISKRRNAL